jgi:hypothetical protein
MVLAAATDSQLLARHCHLTALALALALALMLTLMPPAAQLVQL